LETIVSTSDGRLLRVEEGGDPQGLPVLMLHGMPGTGRLYGPHEKDARARGIRLVGYDRPGYGGSTPQPGRSVADCAADVRTIAAALGVRSLAVWGISGGGPHALACAALLPDLVVAVSSLASTAPFGSSGLDYFDGMGQENVDDIRLMVEDIPAARAKLDTDRERMLGMSAKDVVSAFPTLLSDVDAAVFSVELAEHLHRTNRDGLVPGGEGWWDDGMATLLNWGFNPETIHIPVQIWHGRRDQFVPFQHGEWLAGVIPEVEAHLTTEDGHLTLYQSRIPEVHAWLLDHF
jgi:pimeloyl-ACP methyl ester carboxylesterase